MSQQQLGRAERLLRGLPLAVLAFDRGGLVSANPAAEELLGVTVPTAGRPRAVLGEGALADAVEQVARTGDAVEVETTAGGVTSPRARRRPTPTRSSSSSTT